MTVSSTRVRSDAYTGDGVTTAFPVPFQFQDAGDLRVIQRDGETGTEAIVSSGAYTVTGGMGGTGTVTAASPPPAGVEWMIVRRTPQTQPTDWQDGDRFPAVLVELGLDRLTMALQEAAESASRGLRLPESDPPANTTVPSRTARARKALVFGPDGGVTVSVDDYVDQAVAAQRWASKADGPVAGGDYSALAWATLTGATAPPAGSARQWAESTGTLIGGAGYSAREHASGDTVPTGSARAWAVMSGALVGGDDYSAKEYAVGDAPVSGSARAWAIKTGTPVAGGEYSAKHHATQAALSASAAAGSATNAGTSATNAGISAAAAAASAAGVNLPPITPADSGKVLTVTAGGAWSASVPLRGITVKREGALIANDVATLNAVGSGVSFVDVGGGMVNLVVNVTAPLISAPYWKFEATQTNWNTTSGNQMNIYEWQMFATLDASGTPLSVVGSAASSVFGAYATSRAFDGNTGTDWASIENPGTYQWISAQLGSSAPVRTMKMWFGGASNNPYAPRQAVVKYSQDGSNWTILTAVTPPPIGGVFVTLYVQ